MAAAAFRLATRPLSSVELRVRRRWGIEYIPLRVRSAFSSISPPIVRTVSPLKHDGCLCVPPGNLQRSKFASSVTPPRPDLADWAKFVGCLADIEEKRRCDIALFEAAFHGRIDPGNRRCRRGDVPGRRGRRGASPRPALGEEIRLSVGSPGTLRLDDMPADWRGPGLAVVLKIGTAAMLLAIPESGGLVPGWCAQPDATGQSKLATLAQELAATLVPETLSVEDFRAVRVVNLAGALQRGGVADGAAVIPLELSSGKGAAAKPTAAGLIWPIPRPTLAVGSGAVQGAAEAKPPIPLAPSASRPLRPSGRGERPPSASAICPPTPAACCKLPCRWSSPWRRSGNRWGGSSSWGRARSSSSTNRARRCWTCRWAIIRSPAARRSRSATSSASASPRSPCRANASTASGEAGKAKG